MPVRRRKAKALEIPLSEDFKPTAAHEAYAAKHGIKLEFEVDAMRGWAEGKTAVSWNGVLTTRLANRAKWDAENAKGTGTRKGPVAQHGVAAGVNMDGDASWLKDEKPNGAKPGQLPLMGAAE